MQAAAEALQVQVALHVPAAAAVTADETNKAGASTNSRRESCEGEFGACRRRDGHPRVHNRSRNASQTVDSELGQCCRVSTVLDLSAQEKCTCTAEEPFPEPMLT